MSPNTWWAATAPTAATDLDRGTLRLVVPAANARFSTLGIAAIAA